MIDCRQLTDATGDLKPLHAGDTLVRGSTAVDISAAQFVAGADGWDVHVATASPTVEHPVGQVTMALFVDADGKFENNVTAGDRLGTDTSYLLLSQNGSWMVRRETYIPEIGWKNQPTAASYTVDPSGYRLHIPAAELATDARAYWRTAVAVVDLSTRTTSVDFAPDAGLACAPTIGETSSPVVDVPVGPRPLISNDLLAEIVAGVFVAAIAFVILWKRYKK